MYCVFFCTTSALQLTPLTSCNSLVWLKRRTLESSSPALFLGSNILMLLCQKRISYLVFSLKRTCPLLLNVAVRRTLCLSLVKSQLCFGTQVWSPSHSYLKGKIERVQRRATRWILRSRIGEMSYKERLIRSDLLPLVYDRELNDITFYYKCLYEQIKKI